MKRASSAVNPIAGLLCLLAFTVLAAVLAVPPANILAASGDAASGKTLFEKRCTGCHSLDTSKEGPPLRTVYGRTAGTAPGFQYSDALKSAHLTWDDAHLEKWLTGTDSVIPGNDMDFRVPQAGERADIIAYLRSLTAK